MALLFVFGVMNLVWVAALALFVLAEKVLPVGPLVGVAAGVVNIDQSNRCIPTQFASAAILRTCAAPTARRQRAEVTRGRSGCL